MQDRFKFKQVHTLTGIFVLLMVGLLMTVLIFAGRSQRWFMGNVTVRIVLPEAGAAGIRDGSEVYFLGTLMGTVFDVSVEPSGRMYAHVNIRRDFFRFVRIDSSAVVKRKFGVVGDSYFEIERGKGPPLSEKNASIVCNEQLPSALESAVEEIRSEAVPALKKLSAGLESWTTLSSNLMTSQARLDQLLVQASQVATNLQLGKGTIGQLLVDPTAANELQSLLSHANQSVTELDEIVADFKSASADLKLFTSHLPAISEAVGQEARELPGLVSQTQNSMKELERLITGLQRHWLLRRYIDKPEKSVPRNKPSKRITSPRGSP